MKNIFMGVEYSQPGVGKYLENCGVEPGKGGIWGGASAGNNGMGFTF